MTPILPRDENISKDEQVFIDLALGRREPQNDYERKLLEEIKKLEKQGYIVDLPSNG